MTPEHHIRPDCRLCYGPLTKVLELPATPLANEYPKERGHQDRFPLFLSRCNHCGHVQLPVVVNPERLFRDYAYQSGTSAVFREHLTEFASATVLPDASVAPDVAPLIVDIASNDGSLLTEFRRHGFYRLLGIDPARNLAEVARAKGIETLTEFFNVETARQVVRTHGKAHLITALNVCAHVDDLNGFAAGVAELLHNDGTFVMEVGYLPSVIHRGLFRVIYHEHLSYWHLGALLPFLKRHGLTVNSAHWIDTQGGSIRVYASRRPLTHDAYGKLLANETPANLNVARLATTIDLDRKVLRHKLDTLKAQGKTVCGYGAPAQLTTTCYALGITAQDIDFIVDDNNIKQGRFTPGMNIPIVAPSELYERKPDACVIFSANFEDDIKARHSNFEGQWVTI